MTLRPRFIPVLLVSRGALTKTRAFRDRRYLGDPLNAARIFSDFSADELVILDIDARTEGRSISPDLVTAVADEITMPLAAGGGISSRAEAEALIAAGAEKIILSTSAWRDPYLITETANHLGSSAVTVCVDAITTSEGSCRAYVDSGRFDTRASPEHFARLAEDHGAGEIIIQSIDRDGAMTGYDTRLIASVADHVSIPVVALGGAGNYADLTRAAVEGRANAAAAGSLFVYRSDTRGVLINYPGATELET